MRDAAQVGLGDPLATDERRRVLAGRGLGERDQAMGVAAHAAVGVVSRRRVQAPLLGVLPEAAAGRLGSGPNAQLLIRLLLVECDGDRRVVEVEQADEFLGKSHGRTVPR